MTQLEKFVDRIEGQIAVAERLALCQSADMEQCAPKFDQRETRFHEIASELLRDIIHPRMKTLTNYFVNAELKHSDDRLHCVCSFGYTPQFPATAKLDIGLKHDEWVEIVAVSFKFTPASVFMDYDSQDTLLLPLYAVDRERISSWVEHKLIRFVSMYLQYIHLQRATHSARHTLVTDPVCGMRFNKSSVVASEDHFEHRYYFCSKKCHEKFVEAPGRFVWFKSTRTGLCRQDAEHNATLVTASTF